MTDLQGSVTFSAADAMYLAYDAHKGQQDFDGAAHFTHVHRVASVVPWDCVSVAWLHDVVEDTKTTLEDLRERGLSDVDLEALDRLTRRADETYAKFIDRLVTGRGRAVWIACRVKEVDLLDNLDRCLSMEARSERAASLIPRYRRALVRVLGALTGS